MRRGEMHNSILLYSNKKWDISFGQFKKQNLNIKIQGFLLIQNYSLEQLQMSATADEDHMIGTKASETTFGY